jgi:hypothetical protein
MVERAGQAHGGPHVAAFFAPEDFFGILQTIEIFARNAELNRAA